MNLSEPAADNGEDQFDSSGYYDGKCSMAGGQGRGRSQRKRGTIRGIIISVRSRSPVVSLALLNVMSIVLPILSSLSMQVVKMN